jgi:hypothetical protein
MIVLAIDPGGTVGWATVDMDPSRPLDLSKVIAGQAQHEEFLDWTRQAIGPGWLVLMERFFITANTATLSPEGTHKTLDVIGTVKSLCRWAGAGFEFQSANDAKKFVTNEQLKALGLWRPGADHARDAVRHLIRGIVQHTAGEACEDLKRRMV